MVVEVDQDNLVLEVVPQSTCGSCSVKQGCGTSVLASSVGQKVIHFKLPDTVGAGVGDRVVLGIPENAVVSGSLMMYLLPLVVMFAVALGADQLLSMQDASRDIKIAVSALAGLGISVLLGRRLLSDSPSSYQPVLLRKEIATTVVGSPAGTPSEGVSPAEPG